MPVKIATWNVNSLTARLQHVLDWLIANPVDVLCLQELKMPDDRFPIDVLQSAGYHAAVFGQKTYRQVPVDVDEDTLTAVAEKTGGKYFRADSTDTLRKIYAEIDQFEKSEAIVKKFVRREEKFHWFAIPGLLLLLLEVLLASTVWRRLP